MPELRQRTGFTLIELMIVVVIIGILAAIAIPKFSNVSRNSKQAEADPVLKQICALAQIFRDQNGADAADLAELGTVGWDAPAAKYFTFDFGSGVATATAVDDQVTTVTRTC